MNIPLLAWVGLAALVVAVAAWYLLRSPSKFSPDQVEAFRFALLRSEEYRPSPNRRAYMKGNITMNESLWLSNNFLLYRDTNRWVQADVANLGGVLGGGDFGLDASANAADTYPFMSDWGASIVEVLLKGKKDWVPLSTLMPPTNN